MTAEALISKLDGLQGRGPRWRAICPAHASRHKTRTLAVFEADDGRVLIKCHAGCDVDSIVRAVGMDLADLFPPRQTDEPSKPRIKKPWAARDVVAALQHELTVAWLVLSDVSAGKDLKEADRQRAGVAQKRIGHLIGELTDAA